uniref:Photosystem II reaction center protein Z n=1 Tax=Apophlaea sinclairii TaxID=212746 RepID=A0A1C9CBE2_9FLOR|nr:photosystem II protein Z [Apophlaea sinclairii]AOM65692.1 photosystem II protein Z [Apophlaea sinclairii]
MHIFLQILVLTLILLSILLIISIPVTLASSQQWEKSKGLVFTGAGLWGLLIIITGVINSFIT